MKVNTLRELIGQFLYRDKTPLNERDITVEMNELQMEIFQQSLREDLEKAGLTIVADEDNENPEHGYKFSALKTPLGQVRIIHNEDRFAIYKTKKDESK